LKNSIFELEEYLKNDKSFEEIGTKMLNIWKLSLDEKTYKEIPNETI
jgi:serine/threonine-protein kinase HipA